MITKCFEFYKAEKIPATIEKKLNEFLEGNSFRFAAQQESATTRKVVITIFAEPVSETTKTTIKSRVFRSTSFDEAEQKMNEFLSGGVKLKFFTQSFVENNITSVIFFE